MSSNEFFRQCRHPPARYLWNSNQEPRRKLCDVGFYNSTRKMSDSYWWVSKDKFRIIIPHTDEWQSKDPKPNLSIVVSQERSSPLPPWAECHPQEDISSLAVHALDHPQMSNWSVQRLYAFSESLSKVPHCLFLQEPQQIQQKQKQRQKAKQAPR